MLMDYGLELTTDEGQDITASAYGTKTIDQKAARDPGAGEPMALFMEVVDNNFATLTSLDVALVGDTDGAGTSEVTYVTRNFLTAALTTALGPRRVGNLSPGLAAAKRYLRAKLTVNGSNNSAGAIKVWLGPASDAAPFNAANTL